MGVIKAESEINIAEMSNVSSFLAICLERLRTTTGRTSQTDPIPPKTWLRYEPRTTLCTKISRSSVQILRLPKITVIIYSHHEESPGTRHCHCIDGGHLLVPLISHQLVGCIIISAWQMSKLFLWGIFVFVIVTFSIMGQSYLRHGLIVSLITGWYPAARNHLRESFERGFVSRESIDSTLTAYNNSCACAKMRSELRDACIWFQRLTTLWISELWCSRQKQPNSNGNNGSSIGYACIMMYKGGAEQQLLVYL